MKVGFGQDSHKFGTYSPSRFLMLGGVNIKNHPHLEANSDGDVILHAITNAVSSVTGINILGEKADKMCNAGIKDSKCYLEKALQYLKGFKITHIAISVECSTPHLENWINIIKESLGEILKLSPSDIGITATSGEGLTSFGKGEGIQASAVITFLPS